ncbi:PTS sugar transporter subunit IIA [Microvirga sp. TS319]|uniref:PTS sugar transporter subunit IIA n=1 Tax=Microvirga sp. TS319 TaxID=3241165 RepID=UPI00351A2DFF
MMASLISPACVISRLRTRDVPHAVDALARVAAAKTDLGCDAIRRAVLEQWGASTFGFGRGVAIPHASLPGLARPVGIFARLNPGHDFGAADGILADLMFLLLSPDGKESTHLRALACVARRLRDREVAMRLRSATDAEALHIVLTSDAWRGGSTSAFDGVRMPKTAPI